jgi:hypothetical protein
MRKPTPYGAFLKAWVNIWAIKVYEQNACVKDFLLTSRPEQAMYMKQTVLFFFLLLITVSAFAQDDGLFGTVAPKAPPRNGFILCGNGDFDFPGGDMAQRFGFSARLGPGVLYKTKSNWMIGVKADFIFGNQIKQKGLMADIKDKDGDIITSDGQRIIVPTYERGYMMGLQAGKIIGLSKKNSDNGILLLTSVGFMQHKIDIYDKDGVVSSLQNGYLKGYDRLTNGLFAEEYVAYTYFAKNGLLNFNIGLDASFGFTQGRRDYLYDVMQRGNDKRLDVLFGLRGGWMIPIFKRKSEDMLFQ